MPNGTLIARIRSEFRNHPGIVVTLRQAQALWHLDKQHCAQVLDALSEEGFLRRVNDVYLWTDAPVPLFRPRLSTRDLSS